MHSIPQVISKIVNNDYCIGCGACIAACPNNALEISWNDYGFQVPTKNNNFCDNNGDCLKVCPFNTDFSLKLKNEDDLAEIYLKESSNKNNQIGRYKNTYVGYSKIFRKTSSSGGLATYFLHQLLEIGVVNYVITVASDEKNNENYFTYKIFSKNDEITLSSKTRYHPVNLGEALKQIKSLNGKVAICGVGCFIKAIRLSQEQDLELRSKVVFLVGIICGGVKSKFFTDYLMDKSGAIKKLSRPLDYRKKNIGKSAINYSFLSTDISSLTNYEIKMCEIGDMWGTGLFKANACDYCDDVTTELADLSLGDAWIEPYISDCQGTNIVITRSNLADQILENGIKNGELIIENIKLDLLISSQQGSFNHRQNTLNLRLLQSVYKKSVIPIKRFRINKTPFHSFLVQKMRMIVRQKSLDVWKEDSSAKIFERKMFVLLLILKVFTKVSLLIKKIS